MRGVRVGKTRLTTDSRAHDRQQKLTADRQQKLTADIRSSQQTTEAHNRHQKLTKGSRSSQDRHGEAHSFPLLCELASEKHRSLPKIWGP